jgi:putative MATE family efflux protein
LWRETLVSIRDSFRGHQYDYTRGSMARAIILLAVPMVLEMAMESVFALCDVFFVGRLGSAAVATVGLTEAMVTIIYAFAFGFSMAATALIARRIGEKNPEGAARAATQAMTMALAFGIVAGIPGAIFAPELLALMKAGPEVIETGSGYTAILLGTNVVIVLLFVHNAIFRGAGDALLAMRALWLANGVNLVLDPCLIFGLGPFPELGVKGAAIATTIGRGSGVLFQLWILRRGSARLSLKGVSFRLQPRVMLELVRLSTGSIAQLLIATASWVALMRLVSPFGESAVAGYTIAIRILIFAILPAWGIANAAATLVGQNLGAKQPGRAERAVRLTGWYNAAFLTVVMILALLFGPWLLSFFTTDPETLKHGNDALRIISYGYPFYAWGMVLTQAFKGAGDTWTPTYINLFCFWVIQVPLAWWLSGSTELGPQGVFWSIGISETVLALTAMVVFKRGRWKTVQLAADEAG